MEPRVCSDILTTWMWRHDTQPARLFHEKPHPRCSFLQRRGRIQVLGEFHGRPFAQSSRRLHRGGIAFDESTRRIGSAPCNPGGFQDH